MTISILTIFPNLITDAVKYGILGQSIKNGKVTINPVDLREFTSDKHRSVDGRPFGGGPGMVMRIDVIDKALTETRKLSSGKTLVILLSPQGTPFTEQKAESYTKIDHLILISGRYEGIDQRVHDNLIDQEISIGDYVLSGGEFAALAIVDSVARLIPGVVGNPNSLDIESFSGELLDFPVFTHPKEYRGWKVPEILTTGNHEKISKWRNDQSKIKTTHQRPDLLK